MKLRPKHRRWLAELFRGRFPQLYSTLDDPIQVPSQVQTYRLALDKYLKPGDRVLDVGFGLGYGLKILAEKANELVGIDIDKAAVSRAKSFLREGWEPKVLEVRPYDGYTIPYDDRSFDVVTCVDVIEHVTDYMRLIHSMCRVSRRMVLISTPLQRSEYTQPDGRPRNIWHLREWSIEELENILVQAPCIGYEWNFINGPFEGPCTYSYTLATDALCLAPALFVAEGLAK